MIIQIKINKILSLFKQIRNCTFSLLLVALHCSGVKAQSSATPGNKDSEQFFFQELIGQKYMDASLFHVGQNYRNDWLKGSVLLSSGNRADQLMLRFNSHEDQLIWLSPKFGQIRLDKQIISEFQLFSSDSIIHFKRLKLNAAKDSFGTFYEVAYEGKIQIYIHRKVRFMADYYKYYQRYFLYKPDPDYYLLINQKLVVLDRPRVKTIYAAFPALKDKIRQRIKDNHLKTKTENDFIRVLISVEDLLTKSI
jgi:hypothetical protein